MFEPWHAARLERIESKLDTLISLVKQQDAKMSAELDALTAEVAQEETVEASAITLINGLAAQITAAGTDPAKLTALTQSITASSNALAAAVAANTVAPAPAPAPAVPV